MKSTTHLTDHAKLALSMFLLVLLLPFLALVYIISVELQGGAFVVSTSRVAIVGIGLLFLLMMVGLTRKIGDGLWYVLALSAGVFACGQLENPSTVIVFTPILLLLSLLVGFFLEKKLEGKLKRKPGRS